MCIINMLAMLSHPTCMSTNIAATFAFDFHSCGMHVFPPHLFPAGFRCPWCFCYFIRPCFHVPPIRACRRIKGFRLLEPLEFWHEMMMMMMQCRCAHILSLRCCHEETHFMQQLDMTLSLLNIHVLTKICKHVLILHHVENQTLNSLANGQLHCA